MMMVGLSLFIFIFLYKDIRLFVSKRMWERMFIHRDTKYSNRSLLVQYLGLTLSIVLVSYFFTLPFHLSLLLGFFALIGFTLLISWMFVFNQNLHDFNQYILITSHLSAHFRMNKKILSSLEEVLRVVDKSHHELIESLIHDAYLGKDMVYSFDALSSHYLLKSMVSMMQHAEMYGDEEIDRGLSLLERDVDDLMEDVYQFVGEMFSFRRKLILLVVFGIGIALVSRNMLRMVVDLNLSIYYQNTAYVFLMSMILVVVGAHRVFTRGLMMEEESL